MLDMVFIMSFILLKKIPIFLIQKNSKIYFNKKKFLNVIVC